MATLASDGGGGGAEGDVGDLGGPAVGGGIGNQPDIYLGTDGGINEYIGGSPPAGTYSLLNYPIEMRSSAYLPPGYGKSPEFVVRLPRESLAEIGQPVALECQIDGHPFPDIMWTKDDDDITESDDPNYSFELDAVAGLCRLTIEKCTEYDQGIYRCILENCFGACSSTTSLEISERLPSSPRSSRSAHQTSSSAHASSTSHHHQQQQEPAQAPVVRELTTISEHLSQEEPASSPPFSNSLVSEEPIAQTRDAGEQFFARAVAHDDTIESASTGTIYSASPLELSVATTSNADSTESWPTEVVNKVIEEVIEEAQLSPGSATVRTVMNFDPHWRQFCITPVHSKDNNDGELSEGQESHDSEEVNAMAQHYGYVDAAVPSSPSRRFIDEQVPFVGEQQVPSTATFDYNVTSEDTATPTYTRRQLLIKAHDNNAVELSSASTGGSSVNGACLNKDGVARLRKELSSEKGPTVSQNQFCQEVTRTVTNSSPVALVDEQETSPSLQQAANASLGPSVPIYRTLSSPSAVGIHRRGSFMDYFVDKNPKTKRRTIILQSLIAIQITFLVVLAVSWQERLIEGGSTSTSSSVSRVSLAKAAKHATAATTTTTAMQMHQAQNAPNFFAILTAPLSFVFVLVISSLFTFVFTSTIQL